MSFTNVEQRPVKKRRFFIDESPVVDQPLYSEPSLPDELNALPEASPSIRTRQSSNEGSRLPSSQTDITPPSHAELSFDKSPTGFNRKLFASFVGEDVSENVMQRLRELAGDDMERAINVYLDGSWMDTPVPQPSSLSIMAAFNSGANVPPSNAREAKSSERPDLNALKEPRLLDSMPDYRYVGAFGVGAWATRSGINLVKHGESVKIERTKIKPPVKMGRGGKIIQPSKTSAARMRTDIIVRFTNAKGEEVGRLPKDTAAWVSTLMDQKVCRLEGICVFIPDRVRVNDTIYLQLRCSLLKRAFEAGGFIKPEDNNRTTGIFEEKETSEEKDLRLRQVALVKLFDEINLHPSTANEVTVKHKRQGLLQAAEIAEQDDKHDNTKTVGPSQTDGSSPTANDEAEDGKELEQDQLDTLYKKAQSFDFDTPVREPVDSFVMDLRKYQKQALHWMMSKEKDEKSDSKERSMHPLWEEYLWPTKDVDDKDVPTVANQTSFYVNPYSGELSLEFPFQEQHCLGGILADGAFLIFRCDAFTDNFRNGLGEDHRNAQSHAYAQITNIHASFRRWPIISQQFA